MTDRIRIAEARGWKPSHEPHEQIWIGPDTKAGDFGNYFSFDELPDPENNANHCEALILWLGKSPQDCEIRVEWGQEKRTSPEFTVDVYLFDSNSERHDYHGNNWKKGVCELALKVINKSDSDTSQEIMA